MPRVLIADDLSPAAVAVFRDRGIEADVKTGLKPADLAAVIGEYDGLAVRSSTRVTSALLDCAKRLAVIGRAGIGVDNIDVAAATQRGVIVMNTPFGNSITTAEHAIALMFALARQIPDANASTHAGKWEKTRFLGVELFGKTLGIVGCGNIGSIVADRALGLKMKVVAYDPFLSPERAIDLGVEKVDLDALFRRADFISLHTPLTDQTRNIVDAAAIARMKPGVRIVNCARGGLIVEEALIAALASGHVAGAAIDVFPVEPAKESPFFGLPNVVCTPHLGAATTEAQENVALQVAEQLSDYLLTGAVANALNMPSVTAEEAPKLRPYLALAEQLGSFAGQIAESRLKAVNITYEGDVAALNTKPITAVILAGLLRPLLDSVNMVSAPVVARQYDIDVSDTRREECETFHTLVRLTVTTEGETRSVAGSLFGGAKPRIVGIEDIPLEAELSRHMLFVRNQDKPGLIGRLGTILGNARINIANFNLGRRPEGGSALALVAVDEAVPADIVEAVRALPSVVQAKALAF
jgi:D-3-phosphoglycerate dehydrogenase